MKSRSVCDTNWINKLYTTSKGLFSICFCKCHVHWMYMSSRWRCFSRIEQMRARSVESMLERWFWNIAPSKEHQFDQYENNATLAKDQNLRKIFILLSNSRWISSPRWPLYSFKTQLRCCGFPVKLRCCASFSKGSINTACDITYFQELLEQLAKRRANIYWQLPKYYWR